MQGEIWKPIKDYEGYYEVSSFGRVRSVDRYVEYNNREIHLHKGRILKQFADKGKEYLNVNLNKNGKNKRKRVNRLVAETFISNPENKTEVNHIDENKTNNHVDNLEWVTPKENSNHGTRSTRSGIARRKPIWGYNEENGYIVEFDYLTEPEKKYGLDHGTISDYCKGKRVRAYGYKWFFQNMNDKKTITVKPGYMGKNIANE